MNIQFKKDHWAHRWYNRSKFNRQFPQLSIFNRNPEVIDLHNIHDNGYHVQGTDIDDSEDDSEVVCVEDNNIKEFTVHNSLLQNVNTVVSYKDVLGVATDLCRTVSDDQTLCKYVYVSLWQ